MSVYIIAQFNIHDRAEYDIYEEKFFDVFAQFDGKVLSIDEEPNVLAGDWTATRLVLLEFPSEESAAIWAGSDAYLEIAKHREAASTGKAIMVKSFAPEAG